MNKYHEIVLEVIAIGEGALLLSDGDIEKWVPKTLINNFEPVWEVGAVKHMEVATWKLKDLEFI